MSLPIDQALQAPARIRLLFVDEQIDRVRPALAHLRAFDPRQFHDGVAHAVEIEREETLAQQRLGGGADLFRADVLELGVHAEPGYRPAIAREPAIQHAEDRQRDEGQRDAPGHQFERECTAHGRSSANDVSRTRQHRSSKPMPTTPAALGTSE